MKNQKIPIVFAGTPDIAVPLLRALATDEIFEVKLVITQMDKPSGRKMERAPSPVKKAATELGLMVFQPMSINDPKSIEVLKASQPSMIVVMAYGQIFKKDVLAIPSQGCINLHPSLLPKLRGPTPIQSALLNGDTQTGLSLMKMEAAMDSGPVYEQWEMSIDVMDDSLSLHKKMAEFMAKVAPGALAKIAEGNLSAKAQDDSKTTRCQKISKADGLINWSEDATVIWNKVRAFAGWPSTYTMYNGKQLKILSASASLVPGGKPCKVISVGNGASVSCGTGSLQLKEVQLEGKTPQSIQDFIRGHADFIGSVLG